MSQRPPLNAAIDPAVFLEHYWLKDELTAFCREHGLKCDGPKRLLSLRVAAFLNGETPPPAGPRRKSKPMPRQFSRDTVIGDGWRCSQELRAFLESELGAGFRFDRFMRDRIHNGRGQTLGEVMSEWAARAGASTRSEIEPQFEYNRFVREYRSITSGAAHADIVAAWRRHRDTPVSKRRPIAEQIGGYGRNEQSGPCPD